MPRTTYLAAGAVHQSWADPERSLLELIFPTVREALERSGVLIGDVDSVVLSAHDLVDGRGLTSMMTAPAAGAYLKEEIRLGEDGAAALAVAAAQIQAGMAETCIVAAWGRASEGDGPAISGALFDPFFAGPLGLTELDVSAFRASAALAAYPAYATGRDAAATRRQGLAADADAGAPGPGRRIPAPLRPGEVAPETDIVCAVILTAAATDVELAGIRLSSGPYWPGDRDLLDDVPLRTAARGALVAAGCGAGDVAVHELDGLTLFDEALALEAVGAADRGAGMTLLAGDARVNRSGGYARGACAPAMGLARVAAAAEQLRADGGGTGVGLASGCSGVAGQAQIAAVLRRSA
jgi:acetyl-CoA acetyltransferase